MKVIAVAAALAVARVVLAQETPDSIYAPPSLVPAAQETNNGGVHFGLDVRYMTDYIFRGVELFDTAGDEDAANIQFDTKLSFDLGQLPHPFISVFVNTAEQDDISNFQEVRPTIGFDYTLRPLTFSAGHTSYIYPDRDEIETNELFVKLTFDDSVLFNTEKPILSPYVLAAYDYDQYDGTYVELGLVHTFTLEDTGLSIDFRGATAIVSGYEGLFSAVGGESDSGFQHYELGITARYRLNELLNIPQRYGDWSVAGYLNYTDGMDNDLIADSQLYGGAGISFRY